MKIIRFDQGFRLDDPNSFFGATDGAPAYQLEPGDPGYIPTAPAATSPVNPTQRKTMNETPQMLKPLLFLAKQLRAGATTLETVIGLPLDTAAMLNTAILAIEGDPDADADSNANKGSQLVFKMAEANTDAAITALKAYSDGAVKTLLSGYRRVIEGIHGRSHNAGWASAGFTTKTELPGKHENRLTLLSAMRAYLAAHPDHETSLPRKDEPPLAITAAAALAVSTSFQAAFTLVHDCETAQELTKNLRDADQAALYTKVSHTITNIGLRLSDTDPRWESFGLNIPAGPNPPEAVAEATLTTISPTQERLSWPPARRATYSRLFIKVEGVDEDFRFLARDYDYDHILNDLPPGATVSVYVVAANAGGEAPPSPIVTKARPL